MCVCDVDSDLVLRGCGGVEIKYLTSVQHFYILHVSEQFRHSLKGLTMKVTKTEQNDAREYISRVIGDNPAPRVYTVLRHVSDSGMSRDISVKVIDSAGDLVDISYSVSKLIGWSLRQKGYNAIRVTGCGMDMGFHLVSVLSWNLYGAEGTLKQEWA